MKTLTRNIDSSPDRPRPVVNRWWPVCFLLILVFTFLTRVWRIGYLDTPIFDEVYYTTMATQYIAGIPFLDAHPPSARFVFAALAVLGGAGGNDRFETNTVPYGDFPFRLLRLGSAVAGTLLVACIMLLAREATGNPTVGLVAGFLALFENAFVVESRYALADIFIVFFGTAGLWLFLRTHREQLLSGRWYAAMTAASLFFGLAIGTKVTGGIFLAVAWFIHITRGTFKQISQLKSMFFLFIMPALVLLLLMFIHFSILSPSAPVIQLIGNEKVGPVPGFDKLRARQLYLTPAGIILQRAAESLVGTIATVAVHFAKEHPHPWASPAYSWPFLYRPVLFHLRDAGDTVSVVTLLGNPAIWWGGLVAIVAVVLRRFRRGAFRVADPFLFGYVLNIFLLSPAPRELYLYLYLPSLVFLVIIAAMALEYLFSIHPKLCAALFVTVVVAFIFFAPVSYGLPISKTAFEMRMWLPTWDPFR